MNSMYFSRGFLEDIEKLLPGASKDWAFLRFLLYILEPRKQKDEWECVLWREHLAEIEGKPCNGHYKAEAFLDRIKAAYLPDLAWSEYSYKKGRARALINDGVPVEVLKLVRREWRGEWDHTGLVMENGKPISGPALRKVHREKALQTRALIGPDDCRVLFDMLNAEQRPHLHNRILDPGRLEVVRGIICQKYAADEHTRDYQLGVLRAMELQPVPYYKAVRGCTRLYPANPSLLVLIREGRKMLTPEWDEGDLKSAQVAICARDWNVPYILDYLADSPSLWSNLFRDLGLDPSPERKAVLKDGVYATLFGSSQANVKALLEEGLGIPGIGNQFLTTPILEAMWQARDIQLKKILQEGGRWDCYGQWLSLSESEGRVRHGDERGRRMAGARSILARCAQAYEMKLLAPVIHAAAHHPTNHGFRIMLWQHDGLSIYPLRPEEREKWKSRLTQMVEARAEALCIPTSLEWAE